MYINIRRRHPDFPLIYNINDFIQDLEPVMRFLDFRPFPALAKEIVVLVCWRERMTLKYAIHVADKFRFLHLASLYSESA
jgi:hypothetical protein